MGIMEKNMETTMMGYIWSIWVVVKIMVPFWMPTVIRHLIFRHSKRDHDFDNHPYNPLYNPLVRSLDYDSSGLKFDFCVVFQMPHQTSPHRDLMTGFDEVVVQYLDCTEPQMRHSVLHTQARNVSVPSLIPSR